MKFAATLLVAIVLVGAGGYPSTSAREGGTTLSVMTQNQYFGGDLIAVAGAPDLPSFLAAARAVLLEMAGNNFPERAQAFARQIAERRPHIVGLQEVAELKLNGAVTGVPPFVDQIAATLAALEALDAEYDVIATVRNMALEVPVDLDDEGVLESLVSFTDRDVILARRDLVAANLVQPVSFAGACAKPSGDGCNFSTIVIANTPGGSIALERGFVAVDVALGERVFRVVNTHLEVENLSPEPVAPFVQAAQATELMAVVGAVSAGLPVIVMGDINSTPYDPMFPNPFGGMSVRPFQQFTGGVDAFNNPAPGGAYLDTWLLRPGSPAGSTCCVGDLTAPEFYVWERKDVVFTRDMPLSVKANLVGIDSTDRTPSGLWPSDHAGVWVRFTF